MLELQIKRNMYDKHNKGTMKSMNMNINKCTKQNRFYQC